MLRLERDGPSYEGVIEFNGQTFPATADRQAGALKGSFESEGKRFPFVAVRKQGALRFETGDTTYTPRPRGGGSAPAENPLARPKPAAAPTAVPHPAPGENAICECGGRIQRLHAA